MGWHQVLLSFLKVDLDDTSRRKPSVITSWLPIALHWLSSALLTLISLFPRWAVCQCDPSQDSTINDLTRGPSSGKQEEAVCPQCPLGITADSLSYLVRGCTHLKPVSSFLKWRWVAPVWDLRGNWKEVWRSSVNTYEKSSCFKTRSMSVKKKNTDAEHTGTNASKRTQSLSKSCLYQPHLIPCPCLLTRLWETPFS